MNVILYHLGSLMSNRDFYNDGNVLFHQKGHTSHMSRTVEGWAFKHKPGYVYQYPGCLGKSRGYQL